MKTVPYDRKQKQNREVYLLTAADEREYDVYKSLLDAYGIPVLKKHREAGGYLNISMGMNIYGVDIYVPEECYKDALELINDKNTGESDDATAKEMENAAENFQNRRLAYIWILIAVFYFLPLLIWLVYSMVKN